MGTVADAANASYYRDGEYLVGNFYVTAGTVTGATWSMTLPTGLHINPANYVNKRNYVGTPRRIYAAAGPTTSTATDTSALFIDPGTSTSLIYASAQGGSNNFVAVLGGTILANGDGYTGEFRIPIAEWAGSGTVNLGNNGDEFAASTNGTW